MSKLGKFFILVLLFGLLGLGIWKWKGQSLQALQNPGSQKVESLADDTGDKAPDFPSNLEWLNTKSPVSLKDLRGKVVLLDFWTYCCINCMHVIPDLKKLEKKYPNELVVIGVHSAKFLNEKDTDNIRQAILRYELEHPVVNDKNMDIWDSYGVNSWPTLVLIDPRGNLVGKVSGEGVYEVLDQKIGDLIRSFDAKGLVKREPIRFDLEKNRAPQGDLSFPGKVLADEKSKRLFISDSNHNRIIVSDLDGVVQDVVGQGEIGLKDGGFSDAQFHHPQGLAVNGDKLWVADTENHAIREIDLQQKTVRTVAGTGRQAGPQDSGGKGREASLNSPWDLTLQGNQLFIAMAGSHQIWVLNLQTSEVKPFAGSGMEARVDASRDLAAFAQPSGITSDGKVLYTADSETSSVRALEFKSGDSVKTVVGLDLFEFGDKDGKANEVRLQHPLGIAWAEGKLFVADTYNNKIKQVDPATRTSETFLGDGKPGPQDGLSPRFDEPGGVSIAAGKLYIADTNNDAIRVADLKSRQVETLKLQGLEKFGASSSPHSFKGEQLALPAQTVAPGAGKAKLTLQLPEGYKINPDAPTVISLKISSPAAAFADGKDSQNFPKPAWPLEVPIVFNSGESKLEAEWVLYYCAAEKESLCYFKKARTELPIQVKNDASSHEISIPYAVTLPPKN